MTKLKVNNVDLSQYGVMIEHYPTEVHAQRKVDSISIPGRNGDLIFPQNAFNNVIQSIDIAIKPCGGRTIDENISRVCDAVLSPKGYLRLECDGWTKHNGENIFRLGYYSGTLDLQNILAKYGKTSLKFNCKPQRYLKSGENTLELDSGIEYLKNPTAYTAYPIVKFYKNPSATSYASGMLRLYASEFTNETLSYEQMSQLNGSISAMKVFNLSPDVFENTDCVTADFETLSITAEDGSDLRSKIIGADKFWRPHFEGNVWHYIYSNPFYSKIEIIPRWYTI